MRYHRARRFLRAERRLEVNWQLALRGRFQDLSWTHPRKRQQRKGSGRGWLPKQPKQPSPSRLLEHPPPPRVPRWSSPSQDHLKILGPSPRRSPPPQGGRRRHRLGKGPIEKRRDLGVVKSPRAKTSKTSFVHLYSVHSLVVSRGECRSR